jgi:hypothetical protein
VSEILPRAKSSPPATEAIRKEAAHRINAVVPGSCTQESISNKPIKAVANSVTIASVKMSMCIRKGARKETIKVLYRLYRALLVISLHRQVRLSVKALGRPSRRCGRGDPASGTGAKQ